MRFLQHALLTALFLFTTGTAQVGERRESVEQVQLAGDQSQTPDYGGTDCCNLPIRGNIDCDSYDLIDLIDLVYLIDWMFNGGPGPVCWREANVDGSGHDSLTFETTSEITITDLVYLVEYLFTDGPPPAAMPDHHRWEKTYASESFDEGSAVAQTEDGGYIVTGFRQSPGTRNPDVLLIRTDAWGDPIWTRSFGDSLHEYGYAVAIAPDGDFVIAGEVDWDILVLRVSPEGDLRWLKSYGGPLYDHARSIVVVDGGFLIAGGRGESYTDHRPFIMKLNGDGDSLWTKKFGDTTSAAFSMATTGDSGYALAGWTYLETQEHLAILLTKIDSDHEVLWTRSYMDNSVALGVFQTDDDGFILTGEKNSDFDSDLIILKTDSLGDSVWARVYGENDEDLGLGVVQADDGGFVVAGLLDQWSQGDRNVCLIKLDSEGNEVWVRTYGGENQDTGLSLARTADGGFIVAGKRYRRIDDSEHNDVYLIKTDADGYSQ